MKKTPVYENEEWFDEEFYRQTKNLEGEPIQHEEIGLKGAKRDVDSPFYYSLAVNMKHIFGNEGNLFVDAGCGMGFVVRHLQNLGEKAWGFDISEFAVHNAVTNNIFRADVRHLNTMVMGCPVPDVLICERVLGYLLPEQVQKALKALRDFTRRFLVIVVFTEDAPAQFTDLGAPGRRCLRPTSWWVDEFRKAGLWNSYSRELCVFLRIIAGWNIFIFDKAKGECK